MKFSSFNISHHNYRTGPLINSWCMRMEAKNSSCKQAAMSSNFKNVSYSVAKRHQRHLCAQLQSGTFLDRELQCGPGNNKGYSGISLLMSSIYIIVKQPRSLHSRVSIIVDKMKNFFCGQDVTSLSVYRYYIYNIISIYKHALSYHI